MFDSYGASVAFTSYAIAFVISMLTAGIIAVMVKIINSSNQHKQKKAEEK
jgi:heme exporter protein D